MTAWALCSFLAARLWAAGLEVPAPAAEPGAELLISRGTLLTVSLVDALSSGKNKSGEAFRAKLAEGLWVRGKMAVPQGVTVRGELTEVAPSGRFKGQARMALTLRELEIDGRSYALKTDSLSFQGESHTGHNLGSWLMGALMGLFYGAGIGGKEGAGYGAGVGAAAGAVKGALEGKLDLEYRPGTAFTFEVKEAFEIPKPLLPPVEVSSQTKPAS